MHPMLRRLRSDAVSLFSELTEQMDDVFDLGSNGQLRSPKITVTKDDNKLVVRAEIPGYEKEDVSVKVEDDILIIKASQKKSEEKGKVLTSSITSFERSWELPQNALVDEIEADVRAGILAVTVPLKAEKVRSKDIPIG